MKSLLLSISKFIWRKMPNRCYQCGGRIPNYADYRRRYCEDCGRAYDYIEELINKKMK